MIRDHGRITHIIHRTAIAMDDSVKDIEKGSQSVRILGFYLAGMKAEGNDLPIGLDAVYSAMVGNADGWKREFKRLKRKAYNLALSLRALSQVTLEIQHLAETASVNSMRHIVRLYAPVLYYLGNSLADENLGITEAAAVSGASSSKTRSKCQ